MAQFIASLLLALLHALAGTKDAPPPADRPAEVSLARGQVMEVCKSGLALCPATATCDDPGVVAAVATADGLGLKGVAKGATVCSIASASGAGARRAVRVTVTDDGARPAP